MKVWIHRYRKWLESLIQTKSKNKNPPIYDFQDNSTTEKANFTIHWNNSYRLPNHKHLKLVRSFGISNITMIDHKGFPVRFNNIQEVMERYYSHMIEHYKCLIQKRINVEEERVKDITYKMKFIIHVLRDEIKIIKIKEDIIKSKMEEYEIPFEYYEKSKGKDFSVESYEKHRKMLGDTKEKLKAAQDLKPEKIWLDNLEELRTELKKRFKKGSFKYEKIILKCFIFIKMKHICLFPEIDFLKKK